MSEYHIPILKAGKGFTVKVDTAEGKVADDIYAYALFLGLKTILNRMSKIVKSDFDSEEEFHAAAKAKATEMVANLATGKDIRMTGMKATKKAGGAEKVEARRIAREIVKSQIKASGEKLSQYSAADITEAADALIEANPEIMAEAKANLEAREAKSAKLKVDVSKITKSGKVSKAKPKKEEAPLSAKQAAIPAKHKPAPQHTAH
jgi:phage replication-related protein YjqB (UPF0714/DUF867 family)